MQPQPKQANASFLYVVVLIALLALGLVAFVRSSAFSVQHIVVQGTQQVPQKEIEDLVSGVLGQNLFLFDQSLFAKRIALHPLVRSVTFKRQFPHTLVVSITERTPSALVAVTNGVIEVDGEGVFLRRLEGWPQTDYPVISGVDIPDTAGPGQLLNNSSLAAALKMIGEAPKGMLPLVGEVHVSKVQQLTLFLQSGVEVRLGQAEEWKDKLQVLFRLLQDKDYLSMQQGVRYIDFTAATPVIGR